MEMPQHGLHLAAIAAAQPYSGPPHTDVCVSAIADTCPQRQKTVHPVGPLAANPSGASAMALKSLSVSRHLEASAPTASPAAAVVIAPAASAPQMSSDWSVLVNHPAAPQMSSDWSVLINHPAAPQMSSDWSMLENQLVAQPSSVTDTAPPAWAPAPSAPSVVHANCLCAAASADDLEVDASCLPAAAGQRAQSSHGCSQVGRQQTPPQPPPQTTSGVKCPPQHATAAICPAAPMLGQPALPPHSSLEAERKTPKAETSLDTSSSAWNSTIQVYHSLRREATGQQLLLNTRRLLGSGGAGSVMEVDVKLCGIDSLSVAETPNTALARLLRRTQCACGVHEIRSYRRFRVQAVDSSSSDEDDDDDNDASTTAVVTANSECSSGCCSIRMALKIATAYNDLPASVQRHFTPEQYLQQVQQDCYNEYTLMNKCSKSRYIINCYCVGFIEYKGQQQMCLLLELSQLGSAEQFTIRGGAACGLSDVQAQRIVQQAASGLADLHHMAHTLHRDVKLSNLLLFGSLKDPQVKLCDFGVSRRLVAVGDYGTTTSRGTPAWMAPEQYDSSIGQDYRLDSYALGLLVLALRRASPPFYYLWFPWITAAQKAAGRIAAALDDPLNPYNQSEPGFPALGPIEKAFVKRCLAHDICRRPAPSSLLLTDPYLRKRYGGG